MLCSQATRLRYEAARRDMRYPAVHLYGNHWTCSLPEHPCLRGVSVADVLDAAEHVLRVGHVAAWLLPGERD